MNNPRGYVKSTATSTSSSTPGLPRPEDSHFYSAEVDAGAQHCRVDSLQDDVHYGPHLGYKSLAAENLPNAPIPPATPPHLAFPPPLIHPAPTEKDIEAANSHSDANTPQTNGQTRPTQKLIWHRRIWFRYFTAYRILIGLTILLNVLILGLVLGYYNNTGHALVATSVNLFAAVLVRQEDLINIGFSLVARLPPTLPLRLRTIIADLHHYGGVHIGCAISALLWYIVFVVANTKECVQAIQMGHMLAWHYTDLATCYAFLLCVLIICLTAVPRFREKFHDVFERTHRYAGWASPVVLWVNTGIHTHTAMPAPPPPLYTSPEVYLLAATTFIILFPWCRIRRVPISSTQLSNREVKITFPYHNMPYTSTCRFSSCPAAEWHAFATIPSSSPSSSSHPSTDTASIIVSAAGDWTRAILASPPTHLYIRSPPTANFLSFAPLFASLLLVATGAGIGPMLSLLQSPAIKLVRVVRVMWCVYDPDAPHWAFVQAAIRAVDKTPIVLDSKRGRSDVAFEARWVMEREGLEACMVVSNRGVTGGVVGEVKGLGRGAFGAVFDS